MISYPTLPAAVDGQRFLGARAPPSLSTPFHRGHARRPIAAPGHSPFAEFFAPSRPTPLPAADGVAAAATAAAPEESAAVDSRSSGLLVDDHCTDTTLIASRVSEPNRVSLRFSTTVTVRDRRAYVCHINFITELDLRERCDNRKRFGERDTHRFSITQTARSSSPSECCAISSRRLSRDRQRRRIIHYNLTVISRVRLADTTIFHVRATAIAMSDSESPKPAEEVLMHHHHHPRIPPSLLAWCPAIMPPWCSLLPAAWCNPAALRSAFPGSVYNII